MLRKNKGGDRIPVDYLENERKGKEGNETRTKRRSNRVLSTNRNHNSLKVWHEFFSALEESGMRSLTCLMHLDLRIVAP